MERLAKPLPTATPTSRPFWEGLREGKVRLQHCRACEEWVYYPRSHCRHCLSRDLEWREVAGTGTLHTFSLARVPTAAFFADELPQKLAVVELDEGVRLSTTLVDVNEADIEIGMRLRPVFEATEGGEGVLLRYAPA
jgi:uncharacterized OB-fold protein